MNEPATIPNLPSYPPPRPRVQAVIPASIAQAEPKPHAILNKVIGRVLKTPRLKGMFKMMTSKKNPRPFTKPKKKKIV